MKRYNNLYRKIYDYENLYKAYKNSRKNKTFYKEVKEVDKNPDKYLLELQQSLINKTYKTSEYKTFVKHEKTKDRTIYKLPYFPDRVCQWAILQIIEPIFTETFISSTHASLKGKGIHSALKETSKFLLDKKGTKYCLKLDVRKFFPSVDKEILKQLLRRKIKCIDTLNLLDEIIDSVDSGIPIGNYLSQYFANFYLSYFDHFVKEELGVKYYTRYMDDMVILTDSKEKCWHYKKEIEKYLKDNLNLKLKSNYQVFPIPSRGLDFVGYRNFRKYILIRKDIYKRMKYKLKNISKHDIISQNDGCVIFSYKGWLKYCNNSKLNKKYINELERRYIDDKTLQSSLNSTND